MSAWVPSEAAVEAVIEALWLADGYDLNADPESSTARELRPEYIKSAAAALVAARPIIEAEVRAQIARDIQAACPTHMSRDYTPIDAAYDKAAKIARTGA